MGLVKQFKIFQKLGSFEHGDLTTNETVSEFIHFYPDMWWCSDLLSVIDFDPKTGIYEEVSGDELVYQKMRDFATMRLSVADYLMQVGFENEADEKEIKTYQTWRDYTRKSLSWSNINAAVNLWKKCRVMPSSKLNQTPNLIGTPIGILDIDKTLLTTLEYEIEDRNVRFNQDEQISTGKGLFITKKTRGLIEESIESYLSQTETKVDPRWQQFIDEIANGDGDLSAFLQRSLGYSALVAGNPCECMFVAHGASTRNGKSTLLNSVAYALGDYAKSALNDFLIKKAYSSQGDKDELAHLQGVRLLIISEPPAGAPFDESRAKSLSGNDFITTSKKYGHSFSYEPQFTMWIMSNALPTIRDISLTESGRMVVVPFERHFTRDEQDPTLKDRFKTERGMFTILNWLWKGYLDYCDQGLNPPLIVTQASEQLKLISGTDFDKFVKDCLRNVTGAEVAREEFKNAYFSWCEENGVDVMSMIKVNKQLENRGFGRRRSNGIDWYTSMCLVGGNSNG